MVKRHTGKRGRRNGHGTNGNGNGHTNGRANGHAASRHLGPQQLRFVAEYLCDFNATAAARRAGYSEASAAQQGSRLLRHAHIFDAVQAGLRGLLALPLSDADRVIRETARIAYADPRRLFDPSGKLLAIKDLPDDVAAGLASIEVDEEGRIRKLRHNDKIGALKLLAGIHKLLVKRHEVAGVLRVAALPSADDLRRMDDGQLRESATLLAQEALALVKQIGPAPASAPAAAPGAAPSWAAKAT